MPSTKLFLILLSLFCLGLMPCLSLAGKPEKRKGDELAGPVQKKARIEAVNDEVLEGLLQTGEGLIKDLALQGQSEPALEGIRHFRQHVHTQVPFHELRVGDQRELIRVIVTLARLSAGRSFKPSETQADQLKSAAIDLFRDYLMFYQEFVNKFGGEVKREDTLIKKSVEVELVLLISTPEVRSQEVHPEPNPTVLQVPNLVVGDPSGFGGGWDFDDAFDPRGILNLGPSESNVQSNVQNQLKFFCKVCKTRFMDDAQVARHLLDVHGYSRSQNVYHCPLCNFEGRTRKDLQGHLSDHSEKLYPCQSCAFKSKTPEALNKHYVKHHEEKSESIVDDQSDKEYSAESDQVSKSNLCDHCGKTFKSPRNLEIHQQKFHPSKVEVDSTLNGDQDLDLAPPPNLSPRNDEVENARQYLFHDYSDYKNFVDDSGFEHEERPFKCTRCSERYDDDAELADHIREQHPEAMPYPCPLCDQEFWAALDLGNHLKVDHPLSKLFHCSQCLRNFPTRKNLKDHRRDQHTDYICDRCGHVSHTRHRFKKHRASHYK